jgi:hypothetical protein
MQDERKPVTAAPVLDMDKAKQELVQLIRGLRPGWYPADNTTLYYMQKLLQFLPDYPPRHVAEKSTVKITDVAFEVDAGADTPFRPSPKETEQEHLENKTVALLRRRLFNILDNEDHLLLRVEECENAFKIELVLAKLFPRNDQVLVDESGQPVIEETWYDPIGGDNFTRKSTDIIVYTRTYSTSKEAALEWFKSSLAFQNDGHPKDMDHSKLSLREIASLIDQGVEFHRPSPPTREQEPEPEPEPQPQLVVAEPVSVGEVVGLYIGIFISLYLWMLSATACPPLVLASILMGFVAVFANNRENIGVVYAFIIGMDSVLCYGGLACYVYEAISANTLLLGSAFNVSAMTGLTSLMFTIAVPIMVLTTSALVAWKCKDNLVNVFRGIGSYRLMDGLAWFGKSISGYLDLIPGIGVQPQLMAEPPPPVPAPAPEPSSLSSQAQIRISLPERAPARPQQRPRLTVQRLGQASGGYDSEYEQSSEEKIDIQVGDQTLEFHPQRRIRQ